MANVGEIYKCEVCGNIVAVVHGGAGELVCCGQPMKLLEEHSEDQGYEKHVPVVEETEDGTKVTVGGTLHPMLDAHYIEWIEVIDGNGISYRRFLKPGDQPVAFFPGVKGVVAREYCNLHGLWKSK